MSSARRRRVQHRCSSQATSATHACRHRSLSTSARSGHAPVMQAPSSEEAAWGAKEKQPAMATLRRRLCEAAPTTATTVASPSSFWQLKTLSCAKLGSEQLNTTSASARKTPESERLLTADSHGAPASAEGSAGSGASVASGSAMLRHRRLMAPVAALKARQTQAARPRCSGEPSQDKTSASRSAGSASVSDSGSTANGVQAAACGLRGLGIAAQQRRSSASRRGSVTEAIVLRFF